MFLTRVTSWKPSRLVSSSRTPRASETRVFPIIHVNSLTSTWAARAIDHQRLKMSIAPSRSSLFVYGSSRRITVTRGRNQSCRKWLPMISRGMQQPQDPQQQRPPLNRGNAAVSRMCATNKFLQLTLLHLVTGSSLPAASGPTLGRHHLRSLAPRQHPRGRQYRYHTGQ